MATSKNSRDDRVSKLRNNFAFEFSIWAMVFGAFIGATASNIFLRNIFDSYHVLRKAREIIGNLIYIPLLAVVYLLATFAIIPCIDGERFRQWLLKTDKRRRSIIAGISGAAFIILLSLLLFLLFGVNYMDGFIWR